MLSSELNNFALIIGAMKSGTTTLFHYLAQHPEVVHTIPKEPNFFASDTNFSKGMEWYRKLWDFDPTIHKIALEASTHYTKMPEFPNAAQRIASVGANFKFIYILRDPIARIESQYTHGLAAKWKFMEQPLSEGVHPHAINVSRYARQLDEYYKLFSSDSILLIDFDDLKRDPLGLLPKISNFLDLDPDFKFTLRKVSNQSTGKVINGPIWNFIEPAAQFLPRHRRKKLQTLLGKKITEKVRLTESQKCFVLKELKDDISKLNSEYGFDISKWNIYL